MDVDKWTLYMKVRVCVQSRRSQQRLEIDGGDTGTFDTVSFTEVLSVFPFTIIPSLGLPYSLNETNVKHCPKIQKFTA